MAEYILIQDATSEILTLSEVKNHLKIDGSDYDSVLMSIITTARQIGEKITGRDFVAKTYQLQLDSFPCSGGIEIRKSKLDQVNAIDYLDEAGVAQQFTDFYIAESENYSKIYAESSFPNTSTRKQNVVIEFTTYYSLFPRAIKQAMLSVCAALFENSGDCSVDNPQYKKLFTPYIIPELFFL